MTLSFSVVICTYNRAALLEQALDSLRRLRYAGQFEVIVVNGPSSDGTDAVIERWKRHIRAAFCPAPNLSMSRDIGIAMARGDIVAFIDDDAVVEPEWLTQLGQAYDSPEVGGAGGIVIGHTGVAPQYEYASANRLGGADWQAPGAAPHLCFPGSFGFPYLQGTNASFRRSALLDVGGFDEEFDYYLDETELCCRLVDAGYLIRQLPDAFVHHRFAPSAIRDHQRIVRHYYPIIKNKVYFARKHAREHLDTAHIDADNEHFVAGLRTELGDHVAAGRLPRAVLEGFEHDAERAWRTGVARAEAARPRYLRRDEPLLAAGRFKPFETIGRPGARCVVLVSADYPPDHGGGIATNVKALGEALAAQGDIVHAVVRTRDVERVDLENGVWVHRVALRDVPLSEQARALRVPAHLWNWSATAFHETARIATRRTVDVVEAPVWDVEGIAFLLERRWPLVTALQTTLHFWLASHPEYRDDAHWMAAYGEPVLAMPASSGPHSPGAGLTVLFIGRHEHRKGIDVLLRAIPAVLARRMDARFIVAGDRSLAGPDGVPYADAFLAEHADAPWLAQVSFPGRIGDDAVARAYDECDLFVAPSRFESFGLVFLEAMRAGKPVIGCDAGGMPEVIDDGVTGLLVPPGDVHALAQAIDRLLGDAGLRLAMGAAGKRRFEERFTSAAMARASEPLYRIATQT